MPRMDPNKPVSLKGTVFPVPPPQPDSSSQSSPEAPTPASTYQIPISHPSPPPSPDATAPRAAPAQEVVEVVEVEIPAEHQDAEMLSVSGSGAAPESDVQAQLDSPLEDVLQLEEEQASVPSTERPQQTQNRKMKTENYCLPLIKTAKNNNHIKLLH